MTDANTPGASARLYSETPFDDRGNFHYQGDLYRAGEDLASIASRIARHLTDQFADTRFAVTTQKFAGGRKILAEILDAPGNLTARDDQNAFLTGIRDQMERFGYTRSNLLQDFHSCSFFCEARIGQAYWSSSRKGLVPGTPSNRACRLPHSRSA